MEIIANGDSGLSARTKINALISLSNKLTVTAAAFNANNTDGATFTELEAETNDVNRSAFSFPHDEAKKITVSLPNDGGFTTNKVKVKIKCINQGAADEATDNVVRWKINGLVSTPGDELDVDFGTAVNVDIALSDVSKLYETSQSGEITLGGSSIAANSDIILQIERGNDASDTLEEHVAFTSVEIERNL
jgi:hypothetical protein